MTLDDQPTRTRQNDLTTFGGRLREMRQLHRRTQRAVALELGVTGNAVSGWERGGRAMSVDNVAAIAKLYKVSLDWLVIGHDAAHRIAHRLTRVIGDDTPHEI